MCHESHQDLPNVTLFIHVIDKQFGPQSSMLCSTCTEPENFSGGGGWGCQRDKYRTTFDNCVN